MRRDRLVELTAAGRETWGQAQRAVADAEERALGAIGPLDKERLTGLLERLVSTE